MSKKSQFTRIDRGPTFVGLAPKTGKTKQEKVERDYKKHKHKQEEYCNA